MHTISAQCSRDCRLGHILAPIPAPTVHAASEYDTLPVIAPCEKCDRVDRKRSAPGGGVSLKHERGLRVMFPHAGGLVAVCTGCRKDPQRLGDLCRSGQRMMWSFSVRGMPVPLALTPTSLSNT